MSKLGWCHVGAVLLVAGAAVLPQSAKAGPPRARTLKYDASRKEWVEVPPPPPGTPEGDLHAIRLQIKDGRYRKALSAIKRFVKRHGEQSPAYPGSLIVRAEALIGLRSYYKAHEVLQELLNQFSKPEYASEALRLEFVIAEAYLGGAKRKLAGVPLLSGVDLAYTILDDISTGRPNDPLAEAAVKTKADHLFAHGEHTIAQLEYTRLLRDYRASRYHQFAMKRAAEASLASFAGIPYDQTPLIEAEERFEEYRQMYRSSADREGVGLIVDTIRERRAEKELQVGAYYERTEHLSSAVFYYKLVAKEWPETTAAAKAAARLDLLGVSPPQSAVTGD